MLGTGTWSEGVWDVFVTILVAAYLEQHLIFGLMIKKKMLK